MRKDAQTFQQNIDEARKLYTKEELDAFRENKFMPALIEKLRGQVMDMTQQFYECHPDKPEWPPKDDVLHTYIFRLALCARLHALYVIANGVAKEPEKLPNDYIDVSVAAYATCFDGLLSKDKMTQDIYGKPARRDPGCTGADDRRLVVGEDARHRSEVAVDHAEQRADGGLVGRDRIDGVIAVASSRVQPAISKPQSGGSGGALS
jgi:hypothetical protein